MANLEEIVSRKTENDSQWKARQQADRENLMALQDAAVMEITSSPEAYSRYLDLQGDNPAYSAGNIALAMVQDGDVTVFGTKEKWKMLGRFVLVSENGNGIHIFARSTFGKGYMLADAYDVRHDDDCRGIPCEIAPFIMVNHWGTIILAEPLELPDDGRRYIDEETDWNYDPFGGAEKNQKPCVTVEEFMNQYLNR